jgi:hypothetical protein
MDDARLDALERQQERCALVSAANETDRALVRALTLRPHVSDMSSPDDVQRDADNAADFVAAFRDFWVEHERERIVGLFEALCKNDAVVASVAQWIREGEK